MGSAFIHLSFRIRFSAEESAEETLLSHTCHSESALAVRNLLFAGVTHPFAFFAKRRGLFPSHVGAGALTRPGVDFFRAAEGNLLSHTCHSEERRDESLLSNTCHSESALAESAFCKTVGTFSKPRRGRCPHLPNTLPFPIVILRQRSPSPREGLPTKDPCIPAQAKPRQPAGASFSRLFAKGCRRS